MLYKTGDTDTPDCIKDGNGEVVLGLCRKCGKAESELNRPCWIDDSDPQTALAEVMDGTPMKTSKQVNDEMVQLTGYPVTTTVGSSLAAKIATMPRKHGSDYPLWQGPCGAGPLGGVTQSMIVRFLSCRERFRLKYVCGLEPHDKWVPSLGYGNMWHVCEESHAESPNTKHPTADHLQVWQSRLIEHLNEQLRLYPLQREEIVKWFNVCAVQFPEYVNYWSTHPDVLNRTPLMQEHVFDVPYSLPSGRVVRLRGKFDSVDLIREYGPDPLDLCDVDGIWLQENKTKGDVDRSQIERQLKFDLQTMMYLIALKNLQARNYAVEDRVPILGVRYNVVKRDCPIKQHVGRQLKAGWKDGETTEHWMERLRTEYYGAAPEDYFLRIRSEVSEKDIQVFRETCLDPVLETICSWYEQVTNCYGDDDDVPTCITPPMNYRTPFGVYSALEEGGSTEFDAYMETGSEMGLRRVEELFPELQ